MVDHYRPAFCQPVPRRSNRIKAVYGSRAIEQNTLTLDQATAVLDEKQVLAPLDPYSIDDLLSAHGVMIRELEQESGKFRSSPAGVVNQAGLIVHFGSLSQYVPEAIANLPDAAKMSNEMSDAAKDKVPERRMRINHFLEYHNFIRNVDVRQLFGHASFSA